MINVPERPIEPQTTTLEIIYDIVRSLVGVRKITTDESGITLWFSRKKHPHVTRNRYGIVRDALQKRGLQPYIVAITSSQGLGVRICLEE